jgi:hypothetical protein
VLKNLRLRMNRKKRNSRSSLKMLGMQRLLMRKRMMMMRIANLKTV